jgi:hypothetical protein
VRLADGDPTHAKLFRERWLFEMKSGTQLAQDNRPAQRRDDGLPERLARGQSGIEGIHHYFPDVRLSQ